ncbi:MAG: hypothetical protein RR446_09610, partial [Lachnospiraceae bacterium]
ARACKEIVAQGRKQATSTTSTTYNLPERGVYMANELNIRKAFEAIAYIIGEREHVKITVTSIKKKEKSEEKSQKEETA